MRWRGRRCVLVRLSRTPGAVESRRAAVGWAVWTVLRRKSGRAGSCGWAAGQGSGNYSAIEKGSATRARRAVRRASEILVPTGCLVLDRAHRSSARCERPSNADEAELQGPGTRAVQYRFRALENILFLTVRYVSPPTCSLPWLRQARRWGLDGA